MKYTKPEVVLLESATAAIQSTSKGNLPHQDSSTPTYSFPPAYEADE